MTLVLSNSDVAQVLSMGACLEALQEAFLEAGRGRAAAVPRADIILQTETPGVYYAFKSMSGALAKEKVAAIRLDSDLLHWPVVAGAPRRTKLTAAQDTRLRVGKENGLILLYSAENGELLAMLQDGEVQRVRVGATSALAAKELARADARRVGLFGSGYQAETQLLALARVRRLEEVRVYSPNPEHRADFARRMAQAADVPVYAVDSPEEAAQDADILVAATNSMRPVIEPEWLHPGVHVNCIKKEEVDEAVLDRCDVVVVTSSKQTINYVIGEPDPGGKDEIDPAADGWWARDPYHWERLPLLSDVMVGRIARRQSPDQVTCYLGHGTGIQFAALANLAYCGARERGLGHEIPTEWFLQDVYQR